MEKMKNKVIERKHMEIQRKAELKRKNEEIKEHVKTAFDKTEQSLRDQDRKDMEKLSGMDKKTVLTMQTIMLRRMMWMKDNFMTALQTYGQWIEDMSKELEEAKTANADLKSLMEALTEHGDDQESKMMAKIKKLQTENTKLKKDVTALSEKLEEGTKHVQLPTNNHETINAGTQELVKLIRRTEAKVRRKNLVFSGIEETAHEKPAETYKKIKDVIQKNLFHGIEIDNVRRVGKLEGRKTRKIIVSFKNEWQVEKIMAVKSKLKNLKGAVIYIDRDLPPRFSYKPEEYRNYKTCETSISVSDSSGIE